MECIWYLSWRWFFFIFVFSWISISNDISIAMSDGNNPTLLKTNLWTGYGNQTAQGVVMSFSVKGYGDKGIFLLGTNITLSSK